MATISLTVNGVHQELADADPDMPLLWALRDGLELTGTKYGCGIGLCGACTVNLNDSPVRSCRVPLSAAKGASVRTIEGVADGDILHPLQQAWIELDVPQCGYCNAGQIMSAVALLDRTPRPSDDDVDAAMAGNLCRCGAYGRIRAAIHRAASHLADDENA